MGRYMNLPLPVSLKILFNYSTEKSYLSYLLLSLMAYSLSLAPYKKVKVKAIVLTFHHFVKRRGCIFFLESYLLSLSFSSVSVTMNVQRNSKKGSVSDFCFSLPPQFHPKRRGVCSVITSVAWASPLFGTDLEAFSYLIFLCPQNIQCGFQY